VKEVPRGTVTTTSMIGHVTASTTAAQVAMARRTRRAARGLEDESCPWFRIVTLVQTESNQIKKGGLFLKEVLPSASSGSQAFPVACQIAPRPGALGFQSRWEIWDLRHS
jgi:alkylated DNA nucleotide flippase Atl1